MVTNTNAEDLHLFHRYTISELAALSLYSETYLLAIKHGSHPVREAFRMRMAKALRVSEEVLFAPALAREGGAESKEGSNGHDVGDEGVG